MPGSQAFNITAEAAQSLSLADAHAKSGSSEIVPRRDYYYQKRKELDDDLVAALVPGLTAGVSASVILHGLGGVGKTELAKNYRIAHGVNYAKTFWFNAENLKILIEEYRLIAGRVVGSFSASSLTDKEVIVKAIEWFNAQLGPFLLIFDNAKNYNEIRAFLPYKHAIIFTSQSDAWPNKKINVKEMGNDEAREYMRTVTEIKADIETDATVDMLTIEKLGCLPLALAQAAAYIKAKRKFDFGYNFAAYISDYQESYQTMLADGKLPIGVEGHASIVVTWELSIKAIEAAEAAAGVSKPIAKWLLEQVSLLSPENITLFLLRELVRAREGLTAPPTEDLGEDLKRDFEVALSLLFTYAMLQQTNSSSRMHRLLKQVISGEVPDSELPERMRIITEALTKLFLLDRDSVILTELGMKVLPHVQVVMDYAEKHNISTPEIAMLQLTLGQYYCSEKRQTDRARAYLDRAEAKLPKEKMGEFLITMGFIWNFEGDQIEADNCAQMAYDFYVKHPGDQHQGHGLIVALIVRGHAAIDSKQLNVALAHYQEAYKIATTGEKPLSQRYPLTLGALFQNLGLSYISLNRDLAKEYFDQALNTYRALQDRRSLAIVVTCQTLASIAVEETDYKKAEKYCHEAISVCEKNCVDEPYPEWADALAIYGQVLAKLDKLSEADDCFAKAILMYGRLNNNQKVDEIVRLKGAGVSGSYLSICSTTYSTMRYSTAMMYEGKGLYDGASGVISLGHTGEVARDRRGADHAAHALTFGSSMVNCSLSDSLNVDGVVAGGAGAKQKSSATSNKILGSIEPAAIRALSDNIFPFFEEESGRKYRLDGTGVVARKIYQDQSVTGVLHSA